jgi:hypothetical protein
VGVVGLFGRWQNLYLVFPLPFIEIDHLSGRLRKDLVRDLWVRPGNALLGRES